MQSAPPVHVEAAPEPAAPPNVVHAAPVAAPPPPEAAQAEDKKARATFHLPESLVAEARDAVVALSGPPLRLTLAALVETALRKEIRALRKQHNEGKPFPPFGAPLSRRPADRVFTAGASQRTAILLRRSAWL